MMGAEIGAAPCKNEHGNQEFRRLGRNIRALIVTDTILGIPYYPKPYLIVKAPIIWVSGLWGFRA